MNWKEFYDIYYPDSVSEETDKLRNLLLTHSEMVARKALATARKMNLKTDEQFLYEAAMLHDIGIFRCDAPGIYCHGNLPYICHGVEGSKILKEHGFPRHALVCERHTGSGLTKEDIINQSLPLPLRDMTPKSIEERLICYADKFFSKSGDPTKEKDLASIERSMLSHGEASLKRWRALLADVTSEIL